MKNKELFDRTISILVKAYLNDTLRHGSCMACACGNLIAANNGYIIGSSQWNEGTAVWFNCIVLRGKFDSKETKQTAILQAKSTGYSIKNFKAIEKAFEGARIDKFKQSDRNMYAGLMAVVDVLQTIHNATSVEAAEAKSLFVKVTA